ncbi:MAG: class B sortase [Eubacteriales bacterium]|nr:class B sortase [Eubacteriales bacterium]
MTQRKKRKKKAAGRRSRGRMGLPEKLLLVVLGCGFLFCGWKLFGILAEYRAGTQEYSSLAGRYVTQETQESRAEQEQSRSGEFPQISVDYDALTAANGDFRAWLVIPVLDLEYPVVQGTDNDYYLTHTFEKQTNSSGAIFMDSVSSPDFSDYNTFIYGHNMKNGSMFGSLKSFVREEQLCGSDPYFYLFTKEATYQYRIVSYYVTQDQSDTYYLPAGAQDAADYRERMEKKSLYQSDAETEQAPMVTLSTCYGASGSPDRFVVHGVLTQSRANGAE